MKCRNCGSEIGPGARFCAQCGTEVKAAEPSVKFCEKCGAKLGENAMFCAQCGTPVHAPAPEKAEPVQTEKAPEQTENTRYTPGARVFKMCPECGARTGVEMVYCPECARLLALHSISGQEFLRLKMMSYYEGEPTVGIAKATGELSICDDRIVFEKKMGSSLGSAFGLIGMGIAQKAVKDDPTDEFMLSDVASVKEGRYAAVMPMIVLTLKSGRVVSFCGTANSASVGKAVKLIDEYKNYA